MKVDDIIPSGDLNEWRRKKRRLLKRRTPKNLRSKNPFKNRTSHMDRVRSNRRR